MIVGVSGTSGFIGSALLKYLKQHGHTSLALHRRADLNGLLWVGPSGEDLARLPKLEAVVHLAGANLAEQRWSPDRKAALWKSRVNGTRLLIKQLKAADKLPRAFLCASAIGYYGDCGTTILNEYSPKGTDFLADLVEAWEESCAGLRHLSVRAANLRFGLVLGKNGGALKQMLPIFQLGLGGVLGKGSQYTSWISLEDLLAGILLVISNQAILGPVNFVSPNPVTNAEFTRTLASICNRPARLRLPKIALSALLGEIAERVLLASQRVLPTKLLNNDFIFRHENLADALRAAIGR